MLKKIGLVALCAASAFAMHTAEININDEDLEIAAQFDMGQFNDDVEPDTVLIGGRYLHGGEDNSNVNDVDDYYEISFLMQNQMGNEDLTLGLGLKLNYTEDYSTVPLGAEAKYHLPLEKTIPIFINMAVYYAPSVLTMKDADKYFEYRMSADFEVIDNGKVTLGYRVMNTDYDDARGDVEYNKSMYIGFKFAF